MAIILGSIVLNRELKGPEGGIYIKKIILLIIGLIIVGGLWGYYSRIVTESEQDSNLSIYVNDEYGISLSYNKDWERNDQYDNRYEGKDGFFQFTAFNGQSMDIDEVANHEATHKLEPYGSNPQISELIIQDQEARLIMPSKDQAKEMNNQVEVIIKYPKEVTISGEIYYYFILWTGKEHIQEIVKTIEFIS